MKVCQLRSKLRFKLMITLLKDTGRAMILEFVLYFNKFNL
jgi:hypothetical protein